MQVTIQIVKVKAIRAISSYLRGISTAEAEFPSVGVIRGLADKDRNDLP